MDVYESRYLVLTNIYFHKHPLTGNVLLSMRNWVSHCSDPSSPVNPVNSCIFVLYFVSVLYFYLLLFSVAFIRLLLKYNVYSPLKDIYTSWFLSTVAECGMLRNT